VSVRHGVRFAGATIVRGTSVDPAGLTSIPWWMNPDAQPVVRRLIYVLAGNAAEAHVAGTSRVATPNADDARAAFESLPEDTRTYLLLAERSDGHDVPDQTAAWALAVAFTRHGREFYDLVAADTRAMVLDHLPAIVSVAHELDAGSVLSGPAIDVILAVGEPVEADDGPPTAGRWVAITTFVTGGVDVPVRIGEVLPFHDPRVQAAPHLFLPGDSPTEVLATAIEEYRRSATSPPWSATLEPGPRVMRCLRRLVGRTHGGWVPLTVGEGALARADAWYVRRWPTYFAPSVATD
jgi:hypothetical protein